MLLSDSFISCLDCLLGYSSGEFQASQLVVFVVFGAMYLSLASCMLVDFLEISFEMIVGLQVSHNEEQLFHSF